MLKFASTLFLIVLVALFQTVEPQLAVKPDIALVVVLGLADIYTYWFARISYILLASLILKLYPGIDIGTLLFIIGALTGILIIDFMPGKRFLNLSAAVFIGTLTVNFGLYGVGQFIELILYNLLLMVIMFWLLNKIYGMEKKDTI